MVMLPGNKKFDKQIFATRMVAVSRGGPMDLVPYRVDIMNWVFTQLCILCDPNSTSIKLVVDYTLYEVVCFVSIKYTVLIMTSVSFLAMVNQPDLPQSISRSVSKQ